MGAGIGVTQNIEQRYNRIERKKKCPPFPSSGGGSHGEDPHHTTWGIRPNQAVQGLWVLEL